MYINMGKNCKAWNDVADKTVCSNCGGSDWHYYLSAPDTAESDTFSVYKCNLCRRVFAIRLTDGAIYEEKGDHSLKR